MEEIAIEPLKAKIRCAYSTSTARLDMQKALTEVVTAYFGEGVGWATRRVCDLVADTHFENYMIDALLHKEHTPSGRLATERRLHACGAGIRPTTDDIHFRVAQIEQLKPFADVPDALARLKTRYKIAVLSNGDLDMLEAARRSIRFRLTQ